TPYGQLPVLEVDGKPVAQSLAIARFLAKKFNLVGQNEWEALKCDELVDTLGDLGQKGMRYFREADPEKKETLKKQLFEEDVPYYLSKFEAVVSKNGGYTVGSQLTWSDFQFAGTLEEFEKRHPGLLKPYPALSGLVEKICNLPSIKAYREKSAQKK
ncbi:glutathione S-transferase-like, partial [Sitophilus oryzae]